MRRRRFRPETVPLEPRQLLFIGASATAAPALLVPPNGRFVPVVVEGVIHQVQGQVRPEADFQVVDEYRRVEPRGPITLLRRPDGNYDFRFTTFLEARRASGDKSGRQYYIIVAAQDEDSSGGKVVPILVPNGPVRRAATPASRPRPRR